MTENHDIDVSAVDDGVWVASCSCGWRSEDWEDADDALFDGDEHREGQEWVESLHARVVSGFPEQGDIE